MENKKWWKSRTEWVAILAMVGSIVSGITSQNWFDGETQLMVISVINFVLRLRTNQGLEK